MAPARKPKFVTLHPRDDGTGLFEAFYEDPSTFTPNRSSKGLVRSWGVYPLDKDGYPEVDPFQWMMRSMVAPEIYFSKDGGDTSPEKQFVNALKARKAAQLRALDVTHLKDCDLILRIYLQDIEDANGQPRIWRRIRVASSVRLNVFQDKILSPIMRWERNLHCYIFNDLRDGSLFGPEGSRAVDAVSYTNMVGYGYLPDHRYSLCHLFSKEGETFEYLYDFGDKFYHSIEVERVVPADQSNGQVQILGGAGMCPGENMEGNSRYQTEVLARIGSGPPEERRKAIQEILKSPNYRDYGKPLSLFNVDAFDEGLAHRRLAAALDSRVSVRAGAKAYHMTLAPVDQSVLDERDAEKLGKHEISVRDFGVSGVNGGPIVGGFWEETQTTKRDRASQALCAQCGKPGEDLAKCGGCRLVRYCSREHQTAHWSKHKRECAKLHKRPVNTNGV